MGIDDDEGNKTIGIAKARFADLAVARHDVIVEDGIQRAERGPVDAGSIHQPQDVFGCLVAQRSKWPAADKCVQIDDHRVDSSFSSRAALPPRISCFSRLPMSA